MRHGLEKSQMLQGFKSLVWPYGSFCKVRKRPKRCYQRELSKLMSGMKMDLRPSNITILRVEKYSPWENTAFFPSEENTPPEGVVVAPNVPHVGELRGSMAIELWHTQNCECKLEKKMRRGNTVIWTTKMWGKSPNYKHMNNPFSNEEDKESEEKSWLLAEIIMHSENDVPKSLKEVRKSPEWYKWECTVNDKLAHLLRKGTWKLINNLWMLSLSPINGCSQRSTVKMVTY